MGCGRKLIIFTETGSKRVDGILLFRNWSRVKPSAATFAGSKISPANTGFPRPSLQGAPPHVTCAPKSLEKSPNRSLAFGTVVNVPELGTGRTERKPSKEKKKNVLSCPL